MKSIFNLFLHHLHNVIFFAGISLTLFYTGNSINDVKEHQEQLFREKASQYLKNYERHTFEAVDMAETLSKLLPRPTNNIELDIRSYKKIHQAIIQDDHYAINSNFNSIGILYRLSAENEVEFKSAFKNVFGYELKKIEHNNLDVMDDLITLANHPYQPSISSLNQGSSIYRNQIARQLIEIAEHQINENTRLVFDFEENRSHVIENIIGLVPLIEPNAAVNAIFIVTTDVAKFVDATFESSSLKQEELVHSIF